MSYIFTEKNSTQRICLYCKNTFRAMNSQINRGLGKYCSPRCSTGHRNILNKKPMKERFLESIIQDVNGCWIFTKGKCARYPRIRDENRNCFSAHRYSYILYKGEIPENLYVCHSCDVPRCVNPEHLFLGTPKDNAEDMIKKGRKHIMRGEDQWCSKLSEKDVKNIRHLLSEGKFQRDIAKQFGVRQTTIHKIKHGIIWGHVK